MQIAELTLRNIHLERELQELKALNETLELLALVASKTENAVMILDASGRVEWVNDSFVRLTGKSLIEVRSRDLGDVWAGGETAGTTSGSSPAGRKSQILQRALAQGHSISQEIQQRRPDGETYWAAVKITPVFDEEGRVNRWIVIANDVTEWHLARQDLQQAAAAAEAASLAKGEFLANMSHEIRTPMNVIIGMTELTLGTPLSTEQREYLTAVKNSADSLLRLLNDILDLSKIEAGKLQLETVRFHLPTLLESLLAPLVLEARKRQLRLTWTVAPETPAWLYGDPIRLRQILLNLVDNAVKFTEAGEIAMTVRPQRMDAGGEGLHFSVCDTGIGIAPDKLKTVFDSFTQADSSTTRRFGGTGLGLSISWQLVGLMQGRMWVESREAVGSEFHFVVPLAAAEESRSDERLFELPAAAGLPRILRVLVVDDHPANRLLTARILEKRGHVVLHAANGREALDVIQREPIQLVLMDAQMPEMDGLEATAAIRDLERETTQHLPIIAVTAAAMKGDRERFLAAGMDGYLSKPIRAQDLIRLVETLGIEHAEGLPECPVAAVPRDFAAALARLEGDEEILREQMQLFLADGPTQLARIRQTVATCQADALRIAAHRLKGFAASFDGQAVVDLARQLEERGRDGDLAAAASLCDRLDAAMVDLQTAMQDYLRRTAPV